MKSSHPSFPTHSAQAFEAARLGCVCGSSPSTRTSGSSTTPASSSPTSRARTARTDTWRRAASGSFASTALEPRRHRRRQHRPVHQSLVHGPTATSQVIGQDHLDSRGQAHRGRRRADLRLQHRGGQDDPVPVPARLPDAAMRGLRAAAVMLAWWRRVAQAPHGRRAGASRRRAGASRRRLLHPRSGQSARAARGARRHPRHAGLAGIDRQGGHAGRRAREPASSPPRSSHVCRREVTVDGRTLRLRASRSEAPAVAGRGAGVFLQRLLRRRWRRGCHASR